MQFAVPQFTDVEDKLIGPLTLKQFLMLLATSGLIFFFYSIFNLNIIFFFLSIPLGLAGLALTFGKFNGRPLFSYSMVFFNFVTRPQVRIFKREDSNVTLSFKTEKKVAPIITNPAEITDQSRLKKLAYLLDQKTEEQKQLLDKKQ